MRWQQVNVLEYVLFDNVPRFGGNAVCARVPAEFEQIGDRSVISGIILPIRYGDA